MPGFPPSAFPTTSSSLTSLQSISPQSTAALTLRLLHNPLTPAPSHWAFQGTCVLLWGMYDYGKDCLILIPFRLPQISCFTLSLKCFSSDSDNFPDVGIRPLLQFPHPPRASPFLLTLLLSPLAPLSYQVLRGSVYSFPLVRYSSALSAGIMHALLCPKVYSWCICGERCSAHPPTPPPSCSPYNFFKKLFWRQSGKNHHVLLLQLLQKLLTVTPVSTCTLPQIVQPATQYF